MDFKPRSINNIDINYFLNGACYFKFTDNNIKNKDKEKSMQNIGMIVREDIDNYFVENIKTKEIEVVGKLPESGFKVTEYIAYSLDEKTIHQTYKYNSLPSNSIITETNEIDGLIFFSTPFHIVGCLSQKEAELGFDEFFQKSSCNFVKNLQYIENEADGHYDVKGDIGLYYNERFSAENFVDKFNEKFHNDVKTVRQNLEAELAIIENEKAVIKVSHNLFLVSVLMVIAVILVGSFFRL